MRDRFLVFAVLTFTIPALTSRVRAQGGRLEAKSKPALGQLAVKPSALTFRRIDFSKKPDGADPSKSFVITNVGNDSVNPLMVTVGPLEGGGATDFKIAGPASPFSLAPKASVSFTVNYEPVVDGQSVATIAISAVSAGTIKGSSTRSVRVAGSATGPLVSTPTVTPTATATPTTTATPTGTATATPTATPTATIVPIITTIAGSGRLLSGVGGPATNANLGHVDGVAFDAAGNLFVSDQQNNVVVKVAPSGTLTIAAGTGVGDYTGDGGLAVNATLSSPGNLAFDPAGNLYISDAANNVVRKVTPAGVISTIAGRPKPGNTCNNVEGAPGTTFCIQEPSGLACDAFGNVYISDPLASLVHKVRSDGTMITVVGTLLNSVAGIAGYSGDGGPATAATINGPEGLAIDEAGNLYIADLGNLRVRIVTTDGIIHTLAGNGQFAATGDGGPAIEAAIGKVRGVSAFAGNVYIGTENDFVRKVDSLGIISTVAGTGADDFSGDGGPATNATFREIFCLSVNAGDIYLCDKFNKRVREIDTTGTINTVAGNGLSNFFGDGGPAISAGLDDPWGVKTDGLGNTYIADTGNERVRQVTSDGTILTLAGNGSQGFGGDGGPATDASLNQPLDVAADKAGNVYIADSNNNRIRKVDPKGIITTFAGNGTGGTNDLADVGDGGPAIDATIGIGVSGVAVDQMGNVYIADGQNFRVRKVSGGIITTVAGNGISGNYGDGDGGPATSASVNAYGVAVDKDGSLYIGDGTHNCVRKVDPLGVISTVAGDGKSGEPTLEFSFDPGTLAVDVAIEGGAFIAPSGDGGFYFSCCQGQVNKVSSDGTIAVLVEGFNFVDQKVFGGDGGPAIDGVLFAFGLSVDPAGDLYIVDNNNDRIRKVWIDGLPTPTATPTP
jgi:trimeric autotransporter adhesin